MPLSLSQVETEWRRIARSRRAASAVQRWGESESALAVGSITELVDLPGGPATDAIQLALARLTRTDQLAGTTLLYSVMPGLKSQARRLRTLPLDETIDAALLRMAWEVIATYPVERRPRHVAANILLDTRRNLIAESRAATKVAGELTATGEIVVVDSEPSVDEIVADWRDGYRRVRAYLDEAAQAGWIAPNTADLAWRTWILGQPVGEAHAQVDLSYPAARGRLSRFSRRVQQDSPAAATDPRELLAAV